LFILCIKCIIVLKRHNFLKLTVKTPFVLLRWQFVFVQ
jgi:hypothetical protein